LGCKGSLGKAQGVTGKKPGRKGARQGGYNKALFTCCANMIEKLKGPSRSLNCFQNVRHPKRGGMRTGSNKYRMGGGLKDTVRQNLEVLQKKTNSRTANCLSVAKYHPKTPRLFTTPRDRGETKRGKAPWTNPIQLVVLFSEDRKNVLGVLQSDIGNANQSTPTRGGTQSQ